MLIEDNYIDLNSVIHMANVVTKTGKHVIIVRLKDNPKPIWIDNPNRISVSDLIQENLNASNFNKIREDESEPASKPASKPKRGGSSKRSSKKSDADSKANCSSASTSDGGNPF